MIICEGPDGGGKSTLVRQLSVEFSLPVHERAVDSAQKVMVPNLFDWAYRDVTTMPEQPLSVYDRHCMISEYVYGPICRSKLPEGFATTAAHNLVRVMAPLVLVVVCRPPNERLTSSVSASRDTREVRTHIERIAAAYDAMRVFWPGQIITYDYTSDQSDVEPPQLPRVLAACRIHVAQQRLIRVRSNRRKY